MRYWLGFHLLIVLGYFGLAFAFWGPYVMVGLSLSTGLICIYFRVELAALSRDMMHKKDLWVVTTVLLFLGILLVVLPYLLNELFSYLKGVIFRSDRINVELIRVAFVGAGVGVVYSLLFIRWVRSRSRSVGVQTLHKAFFAVVGKSTFVKALGLFFLPLILAIGLAVVVAISFVLFGDFSWGEIFGEASVDLAVELEYAFLVGGVLLSFIPMYYLTRLWWSRDTLTEALAKEALD